MTEASRIADQLNRAFSGEAWHGDSLLEILDGVSSAQAATRPIPDAHSIWELVLHITAWDRTVQRRFDGTVLELDDAENFPKVQDPSDAAWQKALSELRRVHQALIDAVTAMPDNKLLEMVPGKEGAHYTFYYMLHGVVQHELYHAGQIALLKKI
jgi:uncharacterized damage-inducible protein DinB